MLYEKALPLVIAPVFMFGKNRALNVAWVDPSGRKCQVICERAHGSVEMDVYTAVLSLIYGQEIKRVTIFDICRVLKLNRDNWHKKVRIALENLGNVRYFFVNALDGKSGNFTLLENLERKGHTRNAFYTFSMPEPIKELILAGKYQRYPLEDYLRFSTGFSRRAFEVLERKRNQVSENIYKKNFEEFCKMFPINNVKKADKKRALSNVMQKLVNSGYLVGFKIDSICEFYYKIDRSCLSKESILEKPLDVQRKQNTGGYETMKKSVQREIPGFFFGKYDKSLEERSSFIEYFPVLMKKIKQRKQSKGNVDPQIVEIWIANQEKYVRTQKELKEENKKHREECEKVKFAEFQKQNLEEKEKLEKRERVKAEFLDFILEKEKDLQESFDSLLKSSFTPENLKFPEAIKIINVRITFFQKLAGYINDQYDKNFDKSKTILSPDVMMDFWGKWKLDSYYGKYNVTSLDIGKEAS